MYESCFLTACYKILSVEMILHGKLNEGKNVELKKQITRLSVLRLKSYLKLEIYKKIPLLSTQKKLLPTRFKNLKWA